MIGLAPFSRVRNERGREKVAKNEPDEGINTS
jgi:hypothetical protein